MNNNFKEINRNPFNEKLLHRYLLERFYMDTKKINYLLPEEYRSKKINIVVPESSQIGYRADFEIYFKEESEPLFIEIKWGESTLKKEQLDFLQQNKSCLWSLKEFSEKQKEELKQRNIYYDVIKHEDILIWIRQRISKLWQDTLTNNDISLGNNNWLVVLRGVHTHLNWKKMLQETNKSRFWAFTNNKLAISSALNMVKGDKIYFLLFQGGGGFNNLPIDRKKIKQDFSFKLYECVVSNPHYFSLDNNRGTFFESDQILEVSKRRWVHFIDFIILQEHDEFVVPFSVKNDNPFSNQKLWETIASSTFQGGGSPLLIQEEHLNSMLDWISSSSLNI